MNYSFFSEIYKGKKIFLTGHTGFKGAWLLTWLHQLGASVKGYSLEPVESGLYRAIQGDNLCDSVIADIRNKQKLQQEILDYAPDFIFHLAAQPLVRLSYDIPAETFEVNAIGTANLLECVSRLKKKCTVVIVTTDKVYENRETGHHYKETDVLGGYDPYSASKACTEIVADSFRNSFFSSSTYTHHQKAIATARAGNVIGGGDCSKDRIIPDIIRSLEAGEPVVVRNAKAVRPWQHVLEPLSGYLLLASLLDKNAAQFSSPYNFGPYPQDHLTVRELVEKAIECWGDGTWQPASLSAQPHEAGLLHLDLDKTTTQLDWHPKLNSSEAIQWTLSWHKKDKSSLYDYTVQQVNTYSAL